MVVPRGKYCAAAPRQSRRPPLRGSAATENQKRKRERRRSAHRSATSRKARLARGGGAGRSAQRGTSEATTGPRGRAALPLTRISTQPASSLLWALFEPKIGQEIVID